MSTVAVDMSRNAPKPQTQLDCHGYLFGLKIQASMSPLFHKTIYSELGLRWEQKLFESADIPQFLQLIKNPNFYGAYSLLLQTETSN